MGPLCQSIARTVTYVDDEYSCVNSVLKAFSVYAKC